MHLDKEMQIMREHLTVCAGAIGSGKVRGFLLDLPDLILRNHHGLFVFFLFSQLIYLFITTIFKHLYWSIIALQWLVSAL